MASLYAMVAGSGRKSSEVETKPSDVLILTLAGSATWLGSDIANMPNRSPRKVRLRRLLRRLSTNPRSECRRSSLCLRSSCLNPKISPNITSRLIESKKVTKSGGVIRVQEWGVRRRRPSGSGRSRRKCRDLLQCDLLAERAEDAGEVIAEGEAEEDHHPVEAGNHRQFDQTRAVFHVHEIEHHDHRLEAGDREG